MTRAQMADVRAAQAAVETEDRWTARLVMDAYERGRANAIADDLTVTRRADDLASRLLVALQVRALEDVTTDDVDPRYPTIDLGWSWPTIDALLRLCPLVARQLSFGTGMFPTQVPNPPKLLDAERQALEKAELFSDKPVLTMTAPTPDTYAAGLDTALQVGERATEAVRQLLNSSAATAANDAVLAAFDTAAGAGVADLPAAVNAMTGYAGTPIVVTPVGSADLAASGYPVVVDPRASSTYVVSPTGVSLVVIGPDTMEGLVPARVGRDIAAYVTLIGPVVGAGAVAKVVAPTP
jgi:hypothetical protein